jgi:hypothetical protein
MVPSLRTDPKKPDSIAATGTDGQRLKNLVAHRRGRNPSDAGVEETKKPRTLTGRNPLESEALDVSRRSLTGGVATSGVRTRTGDLRIMRQPKGDGESLLNPSPLVS